MVLGKWAFQLFGYDWGWLTSSLQRQGMVDPGLLPIITLTGARSDHIIVPICDVVINWRVHLCVRKKSILEKERWENSTRSLFLSHADISRYHRGHMSAKDG